MDCRPHCPLLPRSVMSVAHLTFRGTAVVFSEPYFRRVTSRMLQCIGNDRRRRPRASRRRRQSTSGPRRDLLFPRSASPAKERCVVFGTCVTYVRRSVVFGPRDRTTRSILLPSGYLLLWLGVAFWGSGSGSCGGPTLEFY